VNSQNKIAWGLKGRDCRGESRPWGGWITPKKREDPSLAPATASWERDQKKQPTSPTKKKHSTERCGEQSKVKKEGKRGAW